MSNFNNFSIVASFVGLWINSFFNEKTQIVIGFVLIFTFGILHGANDLKIIEKSIDKDARFQFKKMLVFYSLAVFLGAILFYLLPILALIVFVLVSGYHFGEQHWFEYLIAKKSKFNKLFFLIYGLLILALLFVFHSNEVEKIIYDIANIYITSLFLNYFFYNILLVFIVLVLFVAFNNKQFQKIIVRELFLLLVLAILFKTSSLIWGFALYFILWHSIPSMKDQITYMYGKFSVENFLKYFKSAFLYWITALIGIFGLYFSLNKTHIFNALFFSFLAAITFPHVWVILRMFGSKKA